MPALGLGTTLGIAARRVAGFDFSGGVLPPGASLTRASAGMRTNAAGVLVSEPADVARFDHDPVTLRRLGLLVEAAATNRIVRSSAFDDAAWDRFFLTTASGAGPDGGASATRLIDGDAGAYGSLSQTVEATGAAVASIHVAKDAVGAATRFAMLRLVGAGDVRFDTATGERVSTLTTGVVDRGAFWRLWVVLAAAPSHFQLYPAVGSGGLNAAYSSATTGSIAVWGAQLEAGTAPTTPIATGAAAATRAADVLTLDWASRGVADGALAIRAVFDDGASAVTTATVAAGVATVPPTPAGRCMVRVERA